MEKNEEKKKKTEKNKRKNIYDGKKEEKEEKGGQMFVRMSHDHDGIGWEKVEGEERRREKEKR